MPKITFAAGLVSVAGLMGLAPAHAITFAVYDPIAGAANTSLTGLTLTVSAPVDFQYEVPALLGLGLLNSTMSLSAAETGAVAFGPIALGSFDGTFSINYAGATKTVGSITLTPGEVLLDGTFVGAVFSGYGSTGSLQDSTLAGGLVSYNNNALITVSSVADQGLSLSLTNINPVATVVAGAFTPFVGVSQGQFAADVTPSVPEPASWALMLMGGVGIGLAARRRTMAAVA